MKQISHNPQTGLPVHQTNIPQPPDWITCPPNNYPTTPRLDYLSTRRLSHNPQTGLPVHQTYITQPPDWITCPPNIPQPPDWITCPPNNYPTTPRLDYLSTRWLSHNPQTGLPVHQTYIPQPPDWITCPPDQYSTTPRLDYLSINSPMPSNRTLS